MTKPPWVPKGIEARPLSLKYIRPRLLPGTLPEEIWNWSGCETLGVPLEEIEALQPGIEVADEVQ